MRCHYHPKAKAVDYCSICGLPLCRECVVQDDSGVYCEECYAAREHEEVTHEEIDMVDEDGEYTDFELTDLIDSEDEEQLF
ncbi:MAG: hypothetical protein ACUVUU_04170 [bacterium]